MNQQLLLSKVTFFKKIIQVLNSFVFKRRINLLVTDYILNYILKHFKAISATRIVFYENLLKFVNQTSIFKSIQRLKFFNTDFSMILGKRCKFENITTQSKKSYWFISDATLKQRQTKKKREAGSRCIKKFVP